MKRIALLLLACCASDAATVVKIACGGPGGQGWGADAGYSGGLPWVNPPAALSPPFLNLRYAKSFSYAFPLPAGQYTVTLEFIEPNATAIGKRLFNIGINGGLVAATDIDLFAIAGTLKPFSLPIQVNSTGSIQITFTGRVGNAVVSGIQIDSIDPPPIVSTYICEDGLRSLGVGALFPTVEHLQSCENMSDTASVVTRVRCRADHASAVLDLMVANSAGSLVSILPAPFLCTPEGAETVATGSLPAGQDLHWMIRVNDSGEPNGIATFVTVVAILMR